MDVALDELNECFLMLYLGFYIQFSVPFQRHRNIKKNSFNAYDHKSVYLESTI